MSLANSPWPKFRRDNRNTGCSPYIGSASGELKWRYLTGNLIDSSPAIGIDGTIYVGSGDKYLYALSPDGTLKWRYLTGDWVGSSPAIGSDGTIYIGSDDGYLYALNPDGTLKWRYQTGDWVESSPAIGADGTIYFGSYDCYFYALNPNGTLKWRYLTGDWIWSSPAIGIDGTIYVGSTDGYLYAFNPDGTLKWRYQTGDTIWSSPSVGVDGTIYIGSDDGYLYALNPDGTLKWRYLTDWCVRSTPAIGSDGTIYVGSRDYYLYALNPDGTLKWRYLTDSEIRSSPTIGADGTIYIGSYDGYLYALNPDGTLKWRYQTGDWVYSSPAIGTDGTIYFGSWDSYLYAIGVVSFEVTATNPPQNAINVNPDTDIQVTFSDSLDISTISPNTLQVLGTNLEQYEYQWTYDDATKTLTLTIPGGLETDASIIVNLTDGLKSTGGVALTPYTLEFSTAKLPLQCDPPVIVEPYSARCARPMAIVQAPTPARPRAKWRLHFRISAYADEAGSQLISQVDSNTNSELFEYSPDNGLTWHDFPADGLPREQYGKLVRARVEVGPRKKVWLKASAGAEDA